MAQTSPAFTPADILQAGYKAETERRADYAVQFYRHLTDYYAGTPEANEARQALRRLEAKPPQQAKPEPAEVIEAAGGATRPGSLSRALETQASAKPAPAAVPPQRIPIMQHAVAPVMAQTSPPRRRRAPLPAPAHRYRVGRALAVVVVASGWLLVAAAVGILGWRFGADHGLLRSGPPAQIVEVPVLLVATALPLGAVLLLLGQLSLALFRAANAATDIAALMRAGADPDDETD